MARRPNIVITMADDQQASAISALGSQAQTPVLDQMIKEGVCFTQAHHFGSCHGAVCAPSRAMLHSGRNYFNLPTALHTNKSFFKTKEEADNIHALSDKEWQENLEAIQALPLLGGLLGSSGYNTFATGKWHNGHLSFNKSFQDGANIFFGGMCDHDEVPLHNYDSSGSYPNEAIQFGEGFSTDLFVDAATQFINSYTSEAPFFLLVSFTAPHDPRTPLPRYRDMYPVDDIALPANYLPEHPFDNGEMTCRDELLSAFPRLKEDVKKQLAEYFGMITHMDEGIGRIHDALETRGFLSDTLFIHTGDHGLAVGQHGLFGKQNMYEHSIKTPLLMTGPFVPKDKKLDALVYQHDLFPTLLEIAQLDIPETCEFESLWPYLQAEHSEGRKTIFSSYRLGQRSVKSEQYKLIRYFEEKKVGTNTTQLYDYRNDPLEMTDLSQDTKYQNILNDLNKEMILWMDRCSDPMHTTLINQL